MGVFGVLVASFGASSCSLSSLWVDFGILSIDEAVPITTEGVNNNVNLLPDYNLKAGLIMHMFGSKPKLTTAGPEVRMLGNRSSSFAIDKFICIS